MADDTAAKMKEALEEHLKYNNQNGDLDVYLYNMAQWALGEIDDKPNPQDFGLWSSKE